MGFREDAEDYDCFVVEVGGAGLEVGYGVEDGRAVVVAVGWVGIVKDFGEALVSEHLSGGVLGVYDAVGEEDDEVSGAGGEGELFVFGVGEEAEGEAFCLDGFDGDNGRAGGGFCAPDVVFCVAAGAWSLELVAETKMAGRSRRWRSGGSGCRRPRRP